MLTAVCAAPSSASMAFCCRSTGAWLSAVAAFQRCLTRNGILAYSFGLRHAVDADHIAAIDNVTRKLMQQAKPPVAIGCMFSLGHSTIVVIGQRWYSSIVWIPSSALVGNRVVGIDGLLFGIPALNHSYFPISLRTARRGPLEIFRTPSNGEFSARMMKIAPEAASAERIRVVVTAAFRGAR